MNQFALLERNDRVVDATSLVIIEVGPSESERDEGAATLILQISG